MPEKAQSVEELKNKLSALQEEINQLQEKPAREKTKAVKNLFRWQSFSRPYTKRGTKWFIYSGLLILIILLILLFVREFFIIAPVLAIAFVAYILATVPPELIESVITTQGINTSGASYIWEEFEDFWFVEKRGFTILNIDTYLPARRLLILVNRDDREKIREILVRYIPFRELPKTNWIDSAGDFLAHTFHKITS